MFGPQGRDRGVSLLPAASAPAAAAQTLSGFHVQGTAVERLVDGLDARRRLHALRGEVRADRRGGTPPAQLGADAVPQRPRRLQAAPPRPSPRHLGAPLRRRRPVALTAAPGVDLPSHRRGMSTHPTADGGPTRLQILDQRAEDLLAFVQLQRWRLACWYLHRLVLVLAPVIMTGTVHRPMELADGRPIPGVNPRANSNR